MKENPTFIGDFRTQPAESTEGASLLFGHEIPLAGLYGLRGEYIGDNRATIRLPYRQNLTNSRGHIHGGAVAMLFDSALACAVRSHDPQRFGVITVDLSIHFLSACTGDVLAHAHCESRGHSLGFARGEARDCNGKLLALATGAFKLVERQNQTIEPAKMTNPPTSFARNRRVKDQ